MTTTATTATIAATRTLTVWIDGLNREVKTNVPEGPRREKQALYDVWMALTDDERNAVTEMEVVEDEPIAA